MGTKLRNQRDFFFSELNVALYKNLWILIIGDVIILSWRQQNCPDDSELLKIFEFVYIYIFTIIYHATNKDQPEIWRLSLISLPLVLDVWWRKARNRLKYHGKQPTVNRITPGYWLCAIQVLITYPIIGIPWVNMKKKSGCNSVDWDQKLDAISILG